MFLPHPWHGLYEVINVAESALRKSCPCNLFVQTHGVKYFEVLAPLAHELISLKTGVAESSKCEVLISVTSAADPVSLQSSVCLFCYPY